MSSLVSTPFVTEAEYLASSYEGDMDLVDGVLEDRNVGEFSHAMVQRVLLMALAAFEESCNTLTLVEMRTQVAPGRYRVPDVCVIAQSDVPQTILRTPPLHCVEVVSPEDRLPRLLTKCLDYQRFGVSAIWAFDPETSTAHVLHGDLWVEQRAGLLRVPGTPIAVDIQEIFSAARRRARQA